MRLRTTISLILLAASGAALAQVSTAPVEPKLGNAAGTSGNASGNAASPRTADIAGNASDPGKP